ncbi:MAG: outer membrane protein transport protein [Gammaproteobacteria bacterium]|nr:outer membrane protein transport protein [Gammaproteobacteria bacterium]
MNSLVGFNRTLADNNGQRSNITIEASNIDAWGYNAGLLAKPRESITLGLSYRSKTKLKAKNESADFRNIFASIIQQHSPLVLIAPSGANIKIWM